MIDFLRQVYNILFLSLCRNVFISKDEKLLENESYRSCHACVCLYKKMIQVDNKIGDRNLDSNTLPIKCLSSVFYL